MPSKAVSDGHRCEVKPMTDRNWKPEVEVDPPFVAFVTGVCPAIVLSVC